jgi:hypothetical protein
VTSESLLAVKTAQNTNANQRGYVMGSSMQTGLLLVLGTIVSAIGWFAFYPADGTAGAMEQAQAIMGAPTAKLGILLGYGGMIAVLIGVLNITRSMVMAGRAGSFYANIATVLGMALVAGLIMGLGLEYGTASATSAAGGVTLMGVAIAGGAAAQLVLGIVMIMLGAGIALDKNFHVGVAAIAVITGGILLIGSFVDVDGMAMIGWIGFLLTSLVLGALTIRAKSA